MSRSRALLTLVVTTGLAIALHELRRRVAAPPVWSPHELAPWIERHGAATLAVALARVAALSVAVYLVVISATAVTFDVLRWGPSWPARLTPKLLRGMVGLGIAGTLSVPSLAAAGANDVPVLVQVATAPTSSTTPPAPTLVRVGPTAAPAPSTTTAPPPVAASSSSERPPRDRVTTWQVRPGDHFWSIAEATLTAHGIDAADDATIARYWRVLVDANRDRLVVAGNADLIMPGQQLVLPPVP